MKVLKIQNRKRKFLVLQKKMSLLDISDYTEDEDISDDTKYALINNQHPPKGFKFPARQSKDKCKASAVINRYCKEEWFTQFDFISYSVAQDGIYCNNCLLFPVENPIPHKEKPELIVKKPYTNWKKAREDLKIHSVTETHVLSAAKKTAFMKTYMKPDECIDNIMSKHVKDTVQKNRKFLTSIIKCIEFVVGMEWHLGVIEMTLLCSIKVTKETSRVYLTFE